MSSANRGISTEVELGWRSNENQQKNRTTEVDEGWRKTATEEGNATEVDAGWRENTSNPRQATQVDAGWRQGIEDVLDPAKVLNSVTQNNFSSIEDFKNAIEKISELKSVKECAYKVKATISRTGGESIVLLCSNESGDDVAAKVYYDPVNGSGSSISSRSTVLEYMGTEEGKKYTLAVTDFGIVEFGESRYFFEIMPYCTSTDLSDDGEYSFEEIVEITRQLNEALRSIHQAGIIHRDIKPENLYKIDGLYKLGDFGTAKVVVGDAGGTEFVVGTEGYRAPEATRYLASTKSDYYSLGITLASLFEGHFIFKNMDFNTQTIAQESESLPLRRRDDNREQLENLLNGLCRISSKQRFGYEEVKLWLSDHNYSGGGNEDAWPRPFRLFNEAYHDEKSMFYGITQDEKHWEEAKAMLYSKFVEQFFMSFRTDLARAAQIADDIYHADNRDKGLAVFLKSLFAPGPIVWKGYTFNSLSELGYKMANTEKPIAYSELLQNQCISHWLDNSLGLDVNDETRTIVESIEELSTSEPELACYWFGNSFSPNRSLYICGKKVSNLEELYSTLFESPQTFYQKDGLKKLINKKDGADLYGFLYSFGYRDLIKTECDQLKGCDSFNKINILFSMLDDIATKSGVDPKPLRDFYMSYGPVGIAVCTKMLVEQGYYMGLDSEGNQLLKMITEFDIQDNGTIAEIYREYSPLIDYADKLSKILITNPHCILAGVYENKGIIAKNLNACFAYKIFDRRAPLCFNAWIDYTEGE